MKDVRMNEEEYKNWRNDAFNALISYYNEEDVNTVLNWFDTMTGSKELNLIGKMCLEAMTIFTCACDNFKLYNSMMSRLFIYAPLILKNK